MPTYNSLPEFLDDCADAIRFKDGTTAKIQGVAIPERIRAIPSGGGSGVESFNGRTGVVVSQTGDYNASQVDTRISGVSVQQKLDQLDVQSTPDAALSLGSTKAVQNKVVTAEINSMKAMMVPAGGTTGMILAKRTNANYSTEWISTANFMLKTTYDRNNNGIVDQAEEALAVKGPLHTATLGNTTGNTTLLTAEDRGKINGVAPLEADGKLAFQYLPDGLQAGLTFGGTFDASTGVAELTVAGKSALGVTSDTVTLTNDADPTTGYADHPQLFYITQTGGTFAGQTFGAGDWLISTGTKWTNWANSGHVQSVNGFTGAVNLTSDEIPQGADNLYFTPTERSKLAAIEDGATRDLNVIQSAVVTADATGTLTLTLTNKNGQVTTFQGNAEDLTDYLKKNGDASLTYASYTPATVRQAFNGNETVAGFFAKASGWLNLLEDVAFTGQYRDLKNAPTKTSQFTNDGNGVANQPFITRAANDLLNYYTTSDTYSKTEVDALLDAVSNFKYEVVNVLPTSNIDTGTIYYVTVPAPGTGYNRYQYIGNSWVFLGSTDVNMTDYLQNDGDASNTTVNFTAALERGSLVRGDTLSNLMGMIERYISDLEGVAFTGSYTDLVDADELATQADLEDYVPIDQGAENAGKAMIVGADGKLAPQNFAEGVVRKGTGNFSIIGNDSEEEPINTAVGNHATALGYHTQANSDNKFVAGKYNTPDFDGQYAEQIGGGDANNAFDLRTTDWSGNGWYAGKVSVGNTTDNIVVPENGNDLTTKSYVDENIEKGIASANLLRTMVVTQIPDVEDAIDNVLYLIADPTQEDVYFQYKKVLESQNPDVYVMARLGSTQVQSSSFQITELPEASIAYQNAVYQYVGSDSTLKFGFFYTCKNQGYFAWLGTEDAEDYFTTSTTPKKYDILYNSNFTAVGTVSSLSGNTLTDANGKTYIRNASKNTSKYEWQILNSKLSEYVNDGTGSGAPDDYYISKKDLLNMVYPVGSIYITAGSDSPATLFGGTWQIVSNGRVLWGVGESTAAGNTLDAQLPDIRGQIDFGTGSQGHAEFTCSQAFRNSGNKTLTWPQPSGTSTNGRVAVFRASYYNSTYVNNGIVRPAAYTVHMWRRTA